MSGSSSEEEGGADGDGDDIEDITEFDQGLPLSLQVGYAFRLSLISSNFLAGRKYLSPPCMQVGYTFHFLTGVKYIHILT